MNQEAIKKPEANFLDAKKILLDCAHKLHYDDNRRFVRRHMEILASMVDKYEQRGYQVIVEADASDFGSINVYLSPKDWNNNSKTGPSRIEVRVYGFDLNLGDFLKKDFQDPYPDESSFVKAFNEAIAQIKKTKLNLAKSQESKML